MQSVSSSAKWFNSLSPSDLDVLSRAYKKKKNIPFTEVKEVNFFSFEDF